jgi:hypothetical protein
LPTAGFSVTGSIGNRQLWQSPAVVPRENAGARLTGYPAKRVVEQARLVVATSPDGEAEVRLKVAATRLAELRALTGKRDPTELADTITAMQAAIRDANVAVTRAGRSGGSAAELRAQWRTLRQGMAIELRAVIVGPPASSAAQAEAIRDTASSVLRSWASQCRRTMAADRVEGSRHPGASTCPEALRGPRRPRCRQRRPRPGPPRVSGAP